MLNSLEIENFKGVCARQRIDFAPLTLLFGANSAGKSTVLQALLYLHELIERGSADVDHTELGGDALELGGFARLVHRHELNRAIVLRATFSTPGSLDRFGREVDDFPLPDLDDEIESAWLELTVRVRRSGTFRGPLVDRVVIGVNDNASPLVWIETGASLRDGDPLYVRINVEHEALTRQVGALPPADAIRQRQLPLSEGNVAIWNNYLEFWNEIAIPLDTLVSPNDDNDGSPTAREAEIPRGLPVFAVARSRMSALPPLSEPLRVIPFGDDSPEKSDATNQVQKFLEMIILGTTIQLASLLRDAAYIGPLRAVPPRGALYEGSGRPASWADGLAAWDLLLVDRLTLVDDTNAWLRRLGAGSQIFVQQLFDTQANAEDLSVDDVDRTVRRLLLDTGLGSLVLPAEVGAGLSQMIPVIVAAIERRGRLTLVEQPEIHVHPAAQVGLGDLLIYATSRKEARGIFVVETHSEHLILRLLRRIRETFDGCLADGAPSLDPAKLSVTYVENLPEGVRVRRLGVNEQGEFTDRWPKGFFAERMEELL